MAESSEEVRADPSLPWSSCHGLGKEASVPNLVHIPKTVTSSFSLTFHGLLHMTKPIILRMQSWSKCEELFLLNGWTLQVKKDEEGTKEEREKEREGGRGKKIVVVVLGRAVMSLPSHTAAQEPPDPLSHNDSPFEPTLHSQ